MIRCLARTTPAQLRGGGGEVRIEPSADGVPEVVILRRVRVRQPPLPSLRHHLWRDAAQALRAEEEPGG